MKTSNKLFVAAVALVLGSLATYDAALRAEYRTGSYKDPLHNYQALGLRNFDAVRVPSASGLQVRVAAGPFAVHVSKEAADYVRVTQQGKLLLVSLNYPKQLERLWRREAVLITCPRLTALQTKGTYTVAGQVPTTGLQGGGEVEISGFRQDSLLLRQDLASHVELTGNRLGLLRAVAGPTPGSHSRLTLTDNNHIAAASLSIGHQSELTINNVDIPKLKYQFGDSAQVTLTGRALRGGLR